MTWRDTGWNNGVKIINTKGGFVAKIPPNANLNSVEADYPGWKLGQTVILGYNVKTVSGKPQFIAIDGGAPANFSLMIAEGSLQNRWYLEGTSYALLQPALDKPKQTWSVILRPEYWQDVNGKQSASGFKKALKNAGVIQVVFGGKFRAHGVVVKNGTAKFKLLSVNV